MDACINLPDWHVGYKCKTCNSEYCNDEDHWTVRKGHGRGTSGGSSSSGTIGEDSGDTIFLVCLENCVFLLLLFLLYVCAQL